MGRPAGAVLIPPQAARFAALTGADPDGLVLNVTGWNKLVLLGPDRVFLFSRAAAGVEWFERELAVYQALAATRLDIVPRLLGRWQDPAAYPFPFAAVTRLRGAVPAEPEALIGQLGQAIARWHELEPPAVLAGTGRRPGSTAPSGISTSASGAPACGGATAATSPPCGLRDGTPTPRCEAWIRTPAR